jgi:eukaryotic-like serine/threonine-protein kinase
METLDFDSLGPTTHTISFQHHTLPLEPLTEPIESGGLDIQDTLGEGGMGVVYLAQQHYPKREVAVKRLRGKALGLERALVQEAMITGALEHPNIVPIHSLVLSGPHAPEVVMKRVQGKTLWAMCGDAPHSDEALRQLLGHFLQVCNALDFAHTRGIFHRDIKPENIMVGDFGEVYLLDWGIALDSKELSSAPHGLVGSPAYMAPEMLDGDPSKIDARTDVYLLGATLHEVLTGSPRHMAEGLEQTLELVRQSRPHEYGESVAAELATLCNRSCASDPLGRPQSAADFREALLCHLEHWEALLLSEAAEEEHRHFLWKIQDEPGDHGLLGQLFNKARFGYEHSLLIWPGCSAAAKGLQDLCESKIRYHIQEGQPKPARELLSALPAACDRLAEKVEVLEERLEEQKNEQERLQSIGKDFDPTTSRRARMWLGGIIVAILCVFIYMLAFTELGDARRSDPKLLFIATAVLFSPGLLALVFFRKSLLANAHGRRAAIAVATSLGGIVIHRGIAWHLEQSPFVTIVVDMLLVAIAMGNAAPSLWTGPYIAGFALLTIPGIVLFPGTIMYWGVGMGLVMGGAVAYEWIFEHEKFSCALETAYNPKAE